MILPLVLALAVWPMAAFESALVTLGRFRLRYLLDTGAGPRDRLALAERELVRLLTSARVFRALLVIAAAVLAGSWAAQTGGVAWLAVGAVAVLVTSGEVGARLYGSRHAASVVGLLALPVWWLSIIFFPVGATISALTNLVLRPMGVTGPTTTLTSDELEAFLRTPEAATAMERPALEMLAGVLSLAATDVRAVMVPRDRIVAVEATSPITAVVDLAQRTGRSRFPVFGEDLDNIVGIAHLRDLMKFAGAPDQAPTAGDLARPATIIPETISAAEALAVLRAKKSPLAIVISEFGGTSGLVTIEDLVEEIIGDLEFEDEPGEESLVKRLGDGSVLLDGRAPLDQLQEELGIVLGDEVEASVLNGLATERFGYIPRPGESFLLGGYRLTVLKADRSRVRTMRATREEQPELEVGRGGPR